MRRLIAIVSLFAATSLIVFFLPFPQVWHPMVLGLIGTMLAMLATTPRREPFQWAWALLYFSVVAGSFYLAHYMYY